MINQLLKIGITFQLWRWLKPRWRLILISILTVLITWVLHGEYTDYLDKSDSTEHLGISYILKWAITLGVVFFYYGCEKLRLNARSKSSEHSSSSDVSTETKVTYSDPFGKIRNKKKLESRADKLLK